MKKILQKSAASPISSHELAKLRTRVAEAEEALRAIRAGEVDAVVVAGRHGPQVFTLDGAEHAYRVLIESMNEGALTLMADKTVLYANDCFAKMVRHPLEQVIGNSFRRFLSAEDLVLLRLLMKRVGKSGSKIQVTLHAGDGSQIPAQISIRPLAKSGVNHATIGMVVTDMTEARRTEELLRALTQQVVQAQEAERGRVALELHDGITQLLCAVAFYSQALVEGLSAPRNEALKSKAVKLCEIAGRTADEVERISHNLHPSVLEHLGLPPAVREAAKEFEERSGVLVSVASVTLTARLSAAMELALYRILQEALRNVEKHAKATRVTVTLVKQSDAVRLLIKDDGVGFDPDRHPVRRKGKGGLGLLSMRERAIYLGGALKIKSKLRGGTEIEVTIPV